MKSPEITWFFQDLKKKPLSQKKIRKLFFAKDAQKILKKEKSHQIWWNVNIPWNMDQKIGGCPLPAAIVPCCCSAHIWHPKIANLGSPKTTFPKKNSKTFFWQPRHFFRFSKKIGLESFGTLLGSKIVKKPVFSAFFQFLTKKNISVKKF